MAQRYQRGETAVLTTATVNSAGTATTPATSFTITVTNPAGTAVVSAQNMTASATGAHYYNYTIASDAMLGEYRVEYTATNTGSVVTIERDYFVVIAKTAAAAWPYPVGVEECKDHLRVTADSDDDYIEGLIAAATRYVEQATGQRFITKTETQYLDDLDDGMELPWSPLVSVTSITYYDTSEASQTLAASRYQLDTAHTPGRVYIAAGQTFPSVSTSTKNPVCITYTAGYGTGPSTVPPQAVHAIKLLVAHWYENREPVDQAGQNKVPFALESLVWQMKIPRFV